MSKQAAAQAVTVICSAYGQARTEQEAFQRLATVALEDFADRVLLDLVNPKTGIISSSKFLPSIAEMVDWCKSRTYAIAPPVQREVPRLEGPAMPDGERERMLKKFELLQQELAQNSGRDLFQMYSGRARPGQTIDVRSTTYREFCDEQRTRLV
jgi:hypothetical protein